MSNDKKGKISKKFFYKSTYDKLSFMLSMMTAIMFAVVVTVFFVYRVDSASEFANGVMDRIELLMKVDRDTLDIDECKSELIKFEDNVRRDISFIHTLESSIEVDEDKYALNLERINTQIDRLKMLSGMLKVDPPLEVYHLIPGDEGYSADRIRKISESNMERLIELRGENMRLKKSFTSLKAKHNSIKSRLSSDIETAKKFSAKIREAELEQKFAKTYRDVLSRFSDYENDELARSMDKKLTKADKDLSYSYDSGVERDDGDWVDKSNATLSLEIDKLIK
jgi:hypothetical protein